ncbi:MAG: BTAD domain-containing putative transcriptional regulator [Gemmatimonadales bacterium]
MIRCRVLGALDLRDAGGRELRAVLAQPKRLALLVYLALATRRGFTRRDSVLALFWPEHDTEHARNALSQAVHFLRRTLGADVLVSRNGDALAVDPSHLWCDAVAFEQALDAERIGEAVELYRGDLLEGFHIAGAGTAFEHWLEQERKRLAARYDQALEQLAAAREAAGDPAGAVLYWRRLAGRDPYSSRLAMCLMRALVTAGDPGEAIRHSRLHEAVLHDDLDVAPDGEIAAFVRNLQHAGERASSPAPHAASLALQSVPAAFPGRPLDRPRRRVTLMAFSIIGLIAITGGGLILKRALGASPPTPIRSLAVLPLENLSSDSAQQAFVDGMHDVLITELARYPELRVTSRTSVMRYRDSQRELPEIARELKVDAVVEGAIVREGGRIRMTVQLIHGTSDGHLWAERYERDLRDVLVLQSELAQAIARQVRVAALPLPRTPRQSTGPVDSVPQEVYLRELYLRGRHAELSRSLMGVQTAKEAYRRAIELDSTFALGYAGLAAVYGFEADYNYAPMLPALDSARIMARRAVALDSMSPETRTALAVTLGDAHQFDAAEREFRRAIELGPSNARAHYWYSILLAALGRGEETLREAQRAMELDPFSPRGGLAMVHYGTFLTTGERPHFKLPVRERRPILKLEPGEPWARAREGVELAREGRCAEGRSEIDRAQRLAPGYNLRMLAHVGDFYWACGDPARTRAILASMKRHPEVRLNGFRVAWVYVHMGEKDSAFAWLDRHRWTMAELSGLSAGWEVDTLRSDPRFLRLLQRIGIRKR